MVSNAANLIPHSGEDALQATLNRQKRAFRVDPMPSLEARRENLDKLIDAIQLHSGAFVDAISSDFGHRSGAETLSAEVMLSLEGLRYARRRLRGWMRPRKARTGLLMASTRAATECQPKGVVGIVAPWNYPLFLVIRPLTYALAAGNRVMIKPSEFTPVTSSLIAEVIAETFAKDHVTVVTGDAAVAAAFSQLPFNHLLFTGSTGIGRQVMKSAAKHLTPLTLELGGKCPTVIGPEVSLRMAAERICFGKSLNSGQTCTAPDYVLCPSVRQDQLVHELRTAFSRMYPSVEHNDDYTAIANDRHFERLKSLLQDARDKGARITVFNPADEGFDSGNRKLPLHIIQNVSDDMRVANEEIFGPLLPVVSCESMDTAIEYINDRPRPLALNVFDDDSERVEYLIAHTHSGGVCVNDAVMHVAVDDLPFGGTGESGMGRYQGRDGFETFSNRRGVFRRPRWINTARVLYPPYGGRLQRVLHRLFIK